MTNNNMNGDAGNIVSDVLDCLVNCIGQHMPPKINGLRAQLIRNCGKQIHLFTCCCGLQQPFDGTVGVVGLDFLDLFVSNTRVIIPLRHVDALREPMGPPSTGGCARTHMLVEHLNEFTGQCVTTPWCDCNQIRVPMGILGTVTEDSLELRNVNNSGENLIFALDTLCSVMVPATGGTCAPVPPTATIGPTVGPSCPCRCC